MTRTGSRKAVMTVSLPLEIAEELVREARRSETSLGDALLAALLQGTFIPRSVDRTD